MLGQYRTLHMVGLLPLIAMILLSSTSPAQSQATIAGLRVAFQQETNDAARYLAYARQADVEGLAEVSSLFRAIARAEAIHAENQARILHSLGATTRPRVEAVNCGTTEENLHAAMASEDQQQHRSYPALVHRAKQERRNGIAERIQRIRDAEGQHGFVLSQALSNLRLSKSSDQRYFYVCPDCGYTTEEVTFDRCPVCFGAGERFEMLS